MSDRATLLILHDQQDCHTNRFHMSLNRLKAEVAPLKQATRQGSSWEALHREEQIVSQLLLHSGAVVGTCAPPGVWLLATELVVSGTFASRLVGQLVDSSTFAASRRLVVDQLLVVGTLAPAWAVGRRCLVSAVEVAAPVSLCSRCSHVRCIRCNRTCPFASTQGRVGMLYRRSVPVCFNAGACIFTCTEGPCPFA